MGATDLNLRATTGKVRKRHDQYWRKPADTVDIFKSYLKNPTVHFPYLREAKVKDISIQLLHCPREPVSAEILSAELTVETPHTHIYIYTPSKMP